MKSLDLMSILLLDVSSNCGTSTTRDIDYVSRRVEKEGESFFTLTLPTFADDFERSLADGRIAPGSFRSFKKSKKNPLIPCFLSGIMRQIFDKDGRLLVEPSIEAIRNIRQVCRILKKVKALPSRKKVDACYAKFVSNEAYLKDQWSKFSTSPFREYFKKFSRLLWSNLSYERGTPRHGPGAVAEKLLPNEKYQFKTWYQRHETIFPVDEFAIANLNYLDRLAHQTVSPGAEIPVRVIAVPKTQKGPRIIAIEPSNMQYIQQSVLASLAPALERYTKNCINFRDQGINAKLALQESKNGKYATIDLSDASDLVHVGLVYDMLRGHPLLEDLVACRSYCADVPGHGVIRLQKYASMGSALCFPVESMVFYTICLASIAYSRQMPLSYAGLKTLPCVWVYGDDIIAPVESISAVMANLSLCGLKVNTAKSFWTGKFRESCGTDAYDGVNVTPVYVRNKWPHNARCTAEIISAVSLANQLFARGYPRTAEKIKKDLLKLKKIPTVEVNSGNFGFTFGEVSLEHFKKRYSKELQRIEYLIPTVVPKMIDDEVFDHQKLLRFFIMGSSYDERLLQYSIVRGSIAFKTRWRTPVVYGVSEPSIALDRTFL